MKYRNEPRTRLVDRTIGGITHPVAETYSERVPVLPRDWDTIATRIAAGIVLALTAVGITWSTVSIGALLGGGVGYAAAVIFDLSWLTVLLLEWLSRFNAAKRRFPRRAGWLLVAVAAGAIAWHGALDHSAALAVVGALVSVVSKLLWLAVFKHIDRPIGEADAAWLAAEESRLSAQEAIATVRLRAAAAEERAALRMLQAERIRADLKALTDGTEAVPEPRVHAGTPLPSEVPAGALTSTEYAPEGVPEELAARARADFAEHLAAGGLVPSIRDLRARYSIGQAKAQALQQVLGEIRTGLYL